MASEKNHFAIVVNVAAGLADFENATLKAHGIQYTSAFNCDWTVLPSALVCDIYGMSSE